jgi:hypothetical protein
MSIGWRSALLFLLAAPCLAQEEPPPAALRFDLSPIGAYRTTISFGTKSDVPGTVRAVLDARPAYGAAFGVRLDEADLIEFRWSRMDTRVHLEGAVLDSTSHPVTFDQYHGDFTHEYILDHPAWARPYIMGSVGATHMSASAVTTGFTRFSFGLGGGVKFFPTRRLGFRAQGQWLPVWLDPDIRAICGGGCIVHLGGQLSSQGEFAIGPVFRF